MAAEFKVSADRENPEAHHFLRFHAELRELSQAQGNPFRNRTHLN